MPPRKPVSERILDLCIPEPNSGCWIWLGAVANSGYGRIGYGFKAEGTRRTAQAHRAAYELLVGSVPLGLDVCHRCDVRLCVNPEHLFVGTRLENVHDMCRKGRQKKPNPNRKSRSAWRIP